MDSSALDPLRNGAIFKLLAHRGNAASTAATAPGAAAAAAASPATRSQAVGVSSSVASSLSGLSSISDYKISSSDAGTSPSLATASSSPAPHGFDPIYMARVKSRFNELYRATPIPASILYSDAKSALRSVSLSPPGLGRPPAPSVNAAAAAATMSPGLTSPVGNPSTVMHTSEPASLSPQSGPAPPAPASDQKASTNVSAAVGNSEPEGLIIRPGVSGFQIPLKILPSPESTRRGTMTERGLVSEASGPIGSLSHSKRSPIASSPSSARRIQPELLSPSPQLSPVSKYSPPPPAPPPSLNRRPSYVTDANFDRDGQSRRVPQAKGPAASETVGLEHGVERVKHSRKRPMHAAEDEQPVFERNRSKDLQSDRIPGSHKHPRNSDDIDIERPRRGKSKSEINASEGPRADLRPRGRQQPGLAAPAFEDAHVAPSVALSSPTLNNRRSRAQVNSLLSLMAPANVDGLASENADRRVATKPETVSSIASSVEDAAVVRRSRGRPRKNNLSAPSENTAMVAETAPSVLTKASLSSPTESSDVKSAHGLFSLEVWSQEEIRVLKKVHLSVPLELHDFWREVSSRYNRWMSDSYGSEAPFRSARECQDVWFEMLNKASHPNPHPRPPRAAAPAQTKEIRGEVDQPRKRMTQARMKEIAALASISRPDDLFDVLPEEGSNDGVSRVSRYGDVKHRFLGGGESRSTPVAVSRRLDSIRTPQQAAALAADSSGDEAYPQDMKGMQDEVDRYIYKSKSSVDIDSGGADWAPLYARNLAKKARMVVANNKAPRKKIKRVPTALVSEEAFRTETDLAVEKALRQRGAARGSGGGGGPGASLPPRGRVRAEVDLVSGRVRTVVDDEEEEGDEGFVEIEPSDASVESDVSDDD